MKTLLLFDANSIIHRCFHALPPLNSASGFPVQALYGISSILLKIIKEEKPDYSAACFDRPEPTFRKEKFAEYKAQRPKAPSELVAQIISAHDLFENFGIKTFEKAGFEADDIIATLVKRFEGERDLKIVILTGDRDTLQLVRNGNVVVRTFKRGISETETYDEEGVFEKYGLKPNQLVDYKALVGDASDNIKGVPGVGPKTACEILKKFGSLEAVYKNLEEDERIKNRLGPFREQAELAKVLVTLKEDVSIEDGDLSQLEFKPDKARIGNFFSQLGFETLRKRLEGEDLKRKEGKPKSDQGKMF